MNKNCLNRETVKSVAGGRCPKTELEAVRRHLAECARCRAAVVAAATGVQGPGDTVLMKRSDGRPRRWLEIGAVAASLVAAGAAWRYRATPTAPAFAPTPEAGSNATGEPAPTRDHVSSRGLAVQSVSDAPAPSASDEQTDPGSAMAPSPRAELPRGEPTVRIAPIREPAVTEAPRAEAPRAEAPARPRATAQRPSPRPATAPRPAPARPSPSVQEAALKEDFDFGIDEPAAETRQRPIRKTLD